MKTVFYIILFIIALFLSCKQAYNPPAITSSASYLVVDGVINSSSDSTIIKLSYTVNIASNTTTNPVINAIVSVQGDQGVNYPLKEASNGKYFATNLNLDNSHKYRLTITTSDNKQYNSDYVPVLNSPPIDSVYYTISNNAINLNSSTHDPTNKVQYYRWDYKETWVILSAYYSYFKSNGDTVLRRDLINDNIYECWSSDTSSTIVLNSTTKLKQAVLTNNLVTTVPLNSEKVAHRYSILVNQYALTPNAYNFWTNLKKNTEKLGSIFDAQPSQINGNIHCITNPNEPVIGFISIGTVSSKRIFISNTQIPIVASFSTSYGCKVDNEFYKIVLPGGIIINQVNQYINYKSPEFEGLKIPINSLLSQGGSLVGYTASIPQCVDCTLRGTNKQPDFWK